MRHGDGFGAPIQRSTAEKLSPASEAAEVVGQIVLATSPSNCEDIRSSAKLTSALILRTTARSSASRSRPLRKNAAASLPKKLNHVAEERRVALRNIRRDANEHLKKLFKDKVISEDEERQALDSTQKLTDAQIAKIDQVAKAKEKEILEFK